MVKGVYIEMSVLEGALVLVAVLYAVKLGHEVYNIIYYNYFYKPSAIPITLDHAPMVETKKKSVKRKKK